VITGCKLDFWKRQDAQEEPKCKLIIFADGCLISVNNIYNLYDSND